MDDLDMIPEAVDQASLRRLGTIGERHLPAGPRLDPVAGLQQDGGGLPRLFQEVGIAVELQFGDHLLGQGRRAFGGALRIAGLGRQQDAGLGGIEGGESGDDAARHHQPDGEAGAQHQQTADEPARGRDGSRGRP